jgi:sugar phosphate isomerase/epimerase
MNTSRRDFLKKSALALAGTSLLSQSLFAAKEKNVLGLQLYSVRNEMKADPLGTLKQLSQLGYVNVEHANYVDRKFYGYPVTEFKKILDDLGLKMTSGHTTLGKNHWDETKNDFTDAWKLTVDDAATLGQQFVISPSMTANQYDSYDTLLKQMEIFNKSGVLCKKAGMKFGYHNHDFEFVKKFNDTVMYDLMLKNTDASLVAQQLDMGNMYPVGMRAMDIVEKYPGRFESMHVKDVIKVGDKFENTVLGAGVANVKEVLDFSSKKGGTFHFIIEQEQYQEKTPLEAVKADLGVMRKWKY